MFPVRVSDSFVLWPFASDLSTDEAKDAAQTFYEDLGALALEKKYVHHDIEWKMMMSTDHMNM